MSYDNRIISLHAFGSGARGDADSESDFDILCIHNDLCPDEKKVVQEELARKFGSHTSVSFYSPDRIREMFFAGHLFAWHLYKESKPLKTGVINRDFISGLGAPAPYNDALQEIEELELILHSVERGISNCPLNIVYEAGLFYVSLRNIAMSASWYSSAGLNFGRYSPFRLAAPFKPVDVPLANYQSYMGCRLAGSRGTDSPTLEAERFKEDYLRATIWVQDVKNVILRYEKEAIH